MKTYFTLINKTFVPFVLVFSSLFPAYSQYAGTPTFLAKVIPASYSPEDAKYRFSSMTLLEATFLKIYELYGKVLFIIYATNNNFLHYAINWHDGCISISKSLK